MEIVKAGFVYELQNYGEQTNQKLVFTHKDEHGKYVEGTTNEEVIQALIERLYYLQGIEFSCENYVAIEGLKMARKALSKRLTKKISFVNKEKERKKLEEISKKYDHE